MLYALKVASRYLLSSKAQTALLLLGVALGVFIFIFMSALIGGLANYILDSIAGNLSHVSITAEVEEPALLNDQITGQILLAQEKSALRQASVRDEAIYVPMIAALPGVIAVSPRITGSGFMTRGAQVSQVSVIGVEPGQESAIVQLETYMVAGSVRVGTGLVVISQTLADDLDLAVGDSIRLDTGPGITALLTVSGVYKMGQGGFYASSAFVSLDTARTLFALPQGVTGNEIKLADLMDADATVLRTNAVTDLNAESWAVEGSEVLSSLRAGSDGHPAQNIRDGVDHHRHRLVAVAVLLPAQGQDRDHAGDGASRRFVVFVFVSQGALVGLLGGVSGAALGYLFLSLFPPSCDANPGVMPIDMTKGAFGLAIILTVVIATLAAILPAQSAARIDPVTAIGQ